MVTENLHDDSEFCRSEEIAASAIPIPMEAKRIMVNKALGETLLHRAARQGYLVSRPEGNNSFTLERQ